ncbi:MAG: kynureninase [Bdellovibrionales bacterium]|nr:kynureninase [Bdellovibrionales bacterium]
MTTHQEGPEYARRLDAADPLRFQRERFLIPRAPKGEELAYFCGHSLGLQPVNTRRHIDEVRESWAALAADGHFKGPNPWFSYTQSIARSMARLVGAQEHEVGVMNGLSVNLHLMLVSFYRPTKTRFKILIEKGAFSSDRYAVASQLQFHARALGFDPAGGLIEVAPREGETLLRPDDLRAAIDREGKTLALVLLGQVNYLTGQRFDLRGVTEAARKAGAMVGFDLAHGAGNLLDLELHDAGPDFAVWCTYKYMNAGPGAVAGLFVHERHHADPAIPRFAGWYGHRVETRIKMLPDFDPAPGAAGWAVSNPPILSMAPLKASMEIFDSVDLAKMSEKSRMLTGYLEFLLDALAGAPITILTSRRPEERGCQLSIRLEKHGREIIERMREDGVAADFREPSVIRLAPVPLYNSFEDVWRAAQALRVAFVALR